MISLENNSVLTANSIISFYSVSKFDDVFPIEPIFGADAEEHFYQDYPLDNCIGIEQDPYSQELSFIQDFSKNSESNF